MVRARLAEPATGIQGPGGNTVSDAYPDPKLEDPKRPVVDLAAGRPLPKPVSLAQVKANAALKTTELARLPRLSVMPFSEAQFQRLLRLAGA